MASVYEAPFPCRIGLGHTITSMCIPEACKLLPSERASMGKQAEGRSEKLLLTVYLRGWFVCCAGGTNKDLACVQQPNFFLPCISISNSPKYIFPLICGVSSRWLCVHLEQDRNPRDLGPFVLPSFVELFQWPERTAKDTNIMFSGSVGFGVV